MRTISWRNRTASVTASSTSQRPCGPSIIAVATSLRPLRDPDAAGLDDDEDGAEN